MSNTKLLKDLLHDLCNKIAALQGSLELITPQDLPASKQQDLIVARAAVQEIITLIHATYEQQTLPYRSKDAQYAGDPPLIDVKGNPLRRHDPVRLPPPRACDFWEGSIIGVIVSTIQGDGMICVRGPDGTCWDVEATRVEKISVVSDNLESGAQ
jgi:hypothetical protein